jgi:hypothetical protein
MAYDLGDLVRISAAWTNTAGAATDPTAVFVQVKDPAGETTLYTYGTDAALVKDSTGNYHVDVDANLPGTWRYRFYSTGTGQGAEEARFSVGSSRFA